VPRLLLFGPARQVAGTSSAFIPASDVAGVIEVARERFGHDFSRVLEVSKIWVNGDCVEGNVLVGDEDEVAVIPPVSGG
jgi:molybdopterin converting factor small subunit